MTAIGLWVAPNGRDMSYGHTDQKEFQNLAASSANGKIKGMFYGEVTIDPTSLADAAGATLAVTGCVGVSLGDIVLVSFSLDLQDITVTGYVQAADTIEIRVQNEGGAGVNLASGKFRIIVFDVT